MESDFGFGDDDGFDAENHHRARVVVDQLVDSVGVCFDALLELKMKS